VAIGGISGFWLLMCFVVFVGFFGLMVAALIKYVFGFGKRAPNSDCAGARYIDQRHSAAAMFRGAVVLENARSKRGPGAQASRNPFSVTIPLNDRAAREGMWGRLSATR
jgi:hypothetical protein